MSPFRLPIVGVLSLLALVLLGCAGSQEPAPLGCLRSAIFEGTQVPDGRFGFAVWVESENGGCTAGALDASTLLLARHCLPEGASRVNLRLGPRADRCIVKGACDPLPVTVRRHPDLDVAVMRLPAPLLPRPVEGFLRIGGGSLSGDFTVIGYGDGSYRLDDASCTTSAGQRLLSTTMTVSWQDEDYFGALTKAGGPSVCSGDSGGPALLESDAGPVLVGILSGSAADPKGGPCTPADGFQLWLKAAPLGAWIFAK